jgi:hypothetical protein
MTRLGILHPQAKCRPTDVTTLSGFRTIRPVAGR